MTLTGSIAWRDSYAEAADRLADAAPTAAPALTGASACVDAIFTIDAARAAALVRTVEATPASENDARGRELLTEVLVRVAAAHGGELLRRWPAGPSWITGVIGAPDRYQLGGTGPQASWALAELGAPSVLALADRSAQQLAAVDPRTLLCVEGNLRPAASVAPVGEPRKLPHCILEFSAGTPLSSRIVPRSTRVILRFGDEPLECDAEFATLTPTLSEPRAGLLSGLNGLPDADTEGRDWLLGVGAAWAAAGLPTIHHELAEFPTVARLRTALRSGVANSIGLSLSELSALFGDGGDPRLLARDAAQLADARRVIVHADEWALAVHRDDPQREREVLIAGSALAAARARAGRPTNDLHPPDQATYADDIPASGDLGNGWTATTVASPYLRRPAATIGLGDTFVAGLLLAESLP